MGIKIQTCGQGRDRYLKRRYSFYRNPGDRGLHLSLGYIKRLLRLGYGSVRGGGRKETGVPRIRDTVVELRHRRNAVGARKIRRKKT